VVRKQEHKSVVDVLEDKNCDRPVSEVIRDVFRISESSHVIKDLLDAPVTQCDPEG
jgi:hypothetical protein